MVRRMLEFFGVSSVDAWRSFLRGAAIQFRGGDAFEAPRVCRGMATDRRLARPRHKDRQVRRAGISEGAHRSTRSFAVAGKTVGIAIGIHCAAAGVAFVLTREIKRASVSGARWLTKDKALIQLSLKYKSDDQFWFSFFHEGCHVLKHGKKDVFVDYGYSEDDPMEREANEFARDFLIPPEFSAKLPHLNSSIKIRAFARDWHFRRDCRRRLHHDKRAARQVPRPENANRSGAPA